jgi:hypothetical protein
MDEDINTILKTLKLLEENVVETFQNVGIDKDFLNWNAIVH